MMTSCLPLWLGWLGGSGNLLGRWKNDLGWFGEWNRCLDRHCVGAALDLVIF
jgi:hypothetical protein